VKISRPRRDAADEALFAATRTRAVPHEFVLDALASTSTSTRPMFGCLAIYIEDKIVLVLRDKPSAPEDNGVWLATTAEHHPSLRQEFPPLRSIGVFGTKVSSWQVIPADAPDFERLALRACQLVREGDPRIGRIPKRRAIPRSRGRLRAAAVKAKPRRRQADGG